MHRQVLHSYPKNEQGAEKALAYVRGWFDAFNNNAQQHALAKVVVEPSEINYKLVEYRGYYNDEGQEVWPEGQGE